MCEDILLIAYFLAYREATKRSINKTERFRGGGRDAVESVIPTHTHGFVLIGFGRLLYVVDDCYDSEVCSSFFFLGFLALGG